MNPRSVLSFADVTVEKILFTHLVVMVLFIVF